MNRVGKTKPRCNNAFVFNGKRLCAECDQEKDKEKFRSTYTKCKACLGITDRVLKYDHKLKLVSEKEKQKRAIRVAQKKVSQDEFIEKANEKWKEIVW